MKDNPPVNEVALSVQFESLGDLTVLDYADFYEHFKERFPVLQQVAPVTQMHVDDTILVPQFQIMGKPDMPRIWCISSDSHYLVQFQNDRLSFNWRRITPISEPEAYPGYIAVLKEFEGIFERTRTWASERLGQELKPNLGELTYVDVVSMKKADGTNRRLSEVFSFYKAVPPLRTISGFSSSWREALTGTPRGRVQVQAFVTALPDATPAAGMNFTSRVDLAGAQGGPEAWFNESHTKILDLYRILLISGPEQS